MTQNLSKNEQILLSIIQKIYQNAYDVLKELQNTENDLEIKKLFYDLSDYGVNFKFSTDETIPKFSSFFSQNNLRFSIDFDNDLKDIYHNLNDKYIRIEKVNRELENDLALIKSLIKNYKQNKPEIFEFVKTKLIDFDSIYIKTLNTEELEFYNLYFKSDTDLFNNKVSYPMYSNNSMIFSFREQFVVLKTIFNINEKITDHETVDFYNDKNIQEMPILLKMSHEKYYKNKITHINDILKSINRFLSKRDEFSKELIEKFANVSGVKEKVNAYMDLMENYKICLIKIRSKVSAFSNIQNLFEN